MPIKSVHITNYYHKNSGGVSIAYNTLLAAAARHKRHVRLIVPGEKEEVEEISEYAKIYYLRAPKSPVFDKRYRMLMPWQYMLHGSSIRNILLDEMPDMIEVRDKYTLSLFSVMVRRSGFQEVGRPMLVSFSSERMDDNIASFVSGGRFGKWLSRRFMGNYNFPSYDFHITNSPYTAEEFFRSTQGKTNPRRQEWFFNRCWQFFRSPRISIEERVNICPTGVETDRFSPNLKSEDVRREMIERAGIPDDAVVLLYAGRISPEKNIQLLPDLMELLAKDKDSDYRLLIAGAGPQADWLRAETTRRVPNKIIQLGHLDRETVAAYYANADVFIHPNPKEPFGIAPLEAMASGVATVVPNSGGLLCYATTENTWMVEPTAENFADAVREIANGPELRASKIEKALETARNNTRAKSVDFLLATYDRLYEEFQTRNELFTDEQAAKEFDYRSLLA